MVENAGSIAALLQEDRTFPPPPEFTRQANISDPEVYARAAKDPEAFWAGFAAELDWFKPWDKTLEWNPPYAQWFVGGQLNASYNCIDRHLASARRNKAAIIWEGEPGDWQVYTYRDLYREPRCAATSAASSAPTSRRSARWPPPAAAGLPATCPARGSPSTAASSPSGASSPGRNRNPRRASVRGPPTPAPIMRAA